MASGIIPQILAAMDREVLNDLELTRSIAHPGEGGRARENILKLFLRRIVPEAFGISTGFVIDVHGSISRQIDVVVHRRYYHPLLRIGGIDHFMVESVLAVLEVKASITSTIRLYEALDNIKSVKALDRSGGNRNIVLIDRFPGAALDPDNFAHQVFGAIVTEDSLTSGNLQTQLVEFIQAHPRTLWPNLYVDVNRLSVAYRCRDGKIYAKPQDATGLVLWEENRSWTPLVELAFELVNYLRVAPLVDYSATSYFEAADTVNVKGIDISGLE